MKLYFYENIPLSNRVIRIEEEHKIGDQIIDVYLELVNETKIAIEIQHSKILDIRLIERTINYTKKNIYVLWVLNGNSFNRCPQNQDGIRISKLERLLHKMYHGRVYYLNIEPKGILTSVYTLSYAPYFNIKDVVYKKKTISKSSVYCQHIQNLKIKCTSSKYKLALFEDLNIRSSCEMEIYDFLKRYCEEKNREKENVKKNYLIIPVIEIVSLLQEKYGFYLVYDVLRSSTKKVSLLKIRRLGFMKDNKGKVKESIKIYLNDYVSNIT